MDYKLERQVHQFLNRVRIEGNNLMELEKQGKAPAKLWRHHVKKNIKEAQTLLHRLNILEE